MAEENRRTVKNRGANRNKKNNWRDKNGSDEKRHFGTMSGLSRENPRYRNNTRNPFKAPSKHNIHQRPSISIDEIKSNNLLNPKFLNDLVDNQSFEQITTFLVSNMEEYARTLASNISVEPLIALLRLTAKACENSFIVSKSLMLKNVLQKNFVSTICSFLTGLIVNDNVDKEFWQNFGNILNYLLIILENAMQFIPMSSWEYLQTIVKTITLVLPILQKDKEIILDADFEKRILDLRDSILKIENKFKKLKPVNFQNEACNENEEIEPEGDYRFIDIYPDSKELTINERPYIRKNIVKGKYVSVHQYLDIHYRLMREDFLNPVREDFCEFLNNTKKRLFNIKNHKKVIFLKKDVQRNIVCFQVKLEISQALQNMIKTRRNKRFMHGTLLFFSKDNFESIICGRVVNIDDLENGTLLVDLPYDNQIDYAKQYSMIECVTFFEPYYQVLKVLQRLPQDKLPMEKYILNVETNILHPKYMENVRSFRFPSGLNASQIEAMNAALNKEFVIIQGPPGTGKTFLGMALVNILLDQKEFWRELGPILVISFTNHALEQFLSGLSPYTDRLVRLGRNSNHLQDAAQKYGPERQLKMFLQEKYDLVRAVPDPHDDFLVYYNEEYLLTSERDYLKSFDRDFRGLVYYLEHYPDSSMPKYEIKQFDKIVVYEIPSSIRRGLKLKIDLSNAFKGFKNIESTIEMIKSEITDIIYTEGKGINIKICQENNVDYYFQHTELVCWLLCDDGTISSKQNNAQLVDIPLEKQAIDQDKIYYLLCNFVFETEYDDENLKTFFGVFQFNQIAEDLSNYLKTDKDLGELEHRVLREQLDFLLKKIDYFKYCLETDFGPPEVEFNHFPDPFMIPSIHRWQLYKYWIEMYRNKIREDLETYYDEYQRLYDIYNELREMDKVRILRQMDIVGMTTTCAARLRPTLEALRSPIVIIEEAAEVLESHIVTALTNNCQHLIMLGDHQQLRPKTSDYTIEKKYKLGISLFERMVENNVECHTLNVQHRMRPEISSLICPLFYKELFNHRSVEIYPMVSGVNHPLFFIDHMEPEEPYGDSSKMNMHEAKFLIEFAIYLLNNNYQPKDITILAAYLGQSYILKKEQEKSSHSELKRVRIAVVDNFQGEENKIILLSLVRSNSENNVGFLSIDNRVCVALSRAKVGLYIMGNMTQLCNATEIWKSIRATLESQKAIGRFLLLHCSIHKERITFVSKATDFANVPEGGCNQLCNVMLECGHTCVKVCHGYDLNHELYNCPEQCPKLLCINEAHKCKKKCFEKCGSCNYPVECQLPCGHNNILPCSTDVNEYKCMEPVEFQPKCGNEAHKCKQKCFEKCGSCNYPVDCQLPCGHNNILPCSTDFNEYKCMEPVEFQPKCGHTQNIPCFLKTELCGVQNKFQPDDQSEETGLTLFECKVITEKIIATCGHLQMMPCFEEAETFKCQFQVEISLKCGHKTEKQCYLKEGQITCTSVCDQTLLCGHKCRRKCHIAINSRHRFMRCMEICMKNLEGCNNPERHGKHQLFCFERPSLCMEIIMKSYTSCSHIEKLKCHEATSTRMCRSRCNKKLRCGHRCQKQCSETCWSCELTTIKKIPECGHKIKVKCSETPNQENCQKPCTKTLNCGHSCSENCSEPCSKVCVKQCKKELVCGHKCIRKCNESCACKREIIPRCLHSIFVKCGEEISPEKCERLCRKMLDCGHESSLMPCNKPISKEMCSLQSEKTLPCGHNQLGLCREPVDRINCQNTCKKLLECGHKCTKLCCEPCTVECQSRCTKTLECGHPCETKCSKLCTSTKQCLFLCERKLQCGHKCKKRCYQPCSGTCLEECETYLQCGHKCTNNCGSECLTICETICGKKLDCGHRCNKLCGESCIEICQEPCKKTLQCGHHCYNKCFEMCSSVCKSECGKQLECGHACKELCGQTCTETCQSPCQRTLECGHLCKEKCGDPCTLLLNCKNLCEKVLPCKHKTCTNLCNEPCTECTQKCIKILDCGHTCINKCNEDCACAIVKSTDCSHYVRVKCEETPTKLNCFQMCDKILECGHDCKSKCREECKCFESC